jgi:hypothetical protein
MNKENIDIFDFLKFKNTNRKYGKVEPLEDKSEISKMQVTLTTDNGKDFLVYLLVRKYNIKDNHNVQTISDSPYQSIEVVDDSIVCARFDSEKPVVYDMEGKRKTNDSKLTLGELD